MEITKEFISGILLEFLPGIIEQILPVIFQNFPLEILQELLIIFFFSWDPSGNPSWAHSRSSFWESSMSFILELWRRNFRKSSKRNCRQTPGAPSKILSGIFQEYPFGKFWRKHYKHPQIPPPTNTFWRFSNGCRNIKWFERLTNLGAELMLVKRHE